MKKQWLSMILALCMVLCLTPTTAHAAEGETGTLKITVDVQGLVGVDAGGKTFSFEILRKYANYGHDRYVDITIEPGKTEGTVDVPVAPGKYIVKQASHAMIDGYDWKNASHKPGTTVESKEQEVFAGRTAEVIVYNFYGTAVTKEITELPIRIDGYALNAKAGDIKASTDQMRVTIDNDKVTIKQRNASGGWEALASDDTIQADTQYAVEIFVNAKPGYTYTGLKGDKVTVNGKEASAFNNPWPQSGGDMRVFHELDVLKAVKKVDHIEITTPPTKTVYKAGDKFDPTGMVVTAVYKDGTSEPITNYSIFHGDKLTQGQTDVRIQYIDGSGNSGIYVDLPITVGAYEGNHQHRYDDSWYSDENSHWHWCTDKDCPDRNGSTKDQASHTFVWKVDKEATRTQAGSKHEECTVCHFKRNENTEIPTLSGHRPATRPDSGAENTVTSAKTGDAGIALYAGLSLLALSGSGWAVGKKRRGEK